MTSIGSSAFEGCSSLTNIVIPKGVTSISFSAFRGCSGLASITIPEGVTSIGFLAFGGCSSLTGITIPASVTFIDSYAFSNCTKLEIVRIDSPTVISALDVVTAAGELIKNAKIICIPASIPALPAYVQNIYTVSAEIVQDGMPYAVRSTRAFVWMPRNDTQHKLTGDHGAVIYADHIYGAWVKHNATQHKRVCECGSVGYADHTFGEWETTKEATKKECGTRTKACPCGYSVSEEIPQLESNVGVVIGAVGGGTAVVGGGGFALWWFIFRKKKLV